MSSVNRYTPTSPHFSPSSLTVEKDLKKEKEVEAKVRISERSASRPSDLHKKVTHLSESATSPEQIASLQPSQALKDSSKLADEEFQKIMTLYRSAQHDSSPLEESPDVKVWYEIQKKITTIRCALSSTSEINPKHTKSLPSLLAKLLPLFRGISSFEQLGIFTLGQIVSLSVPLIITYYDEYTTKEKDPDDYFDTSFTGFAESWLFRRYSNQETVHFLNEYRKLIPSKCPYAQTLKGALTALTILMGQSEFYNEPVFVKTSQPTLETCQTLCIYFMQSLIYAMTADNTIPKQLFDGVIYFQDKLYDYKDDLVKRKRNLDQKGKTLKSNLLELLALESKLSIAKEIEFFHNSINIGILKLSLLCKRAVVAKDKAPWEIKLILAYDRQLVIAIKKAYQKLQSLKNEAFSRYESRLKDAMVENPREEWDKQHKDQEAIFDLIPKSMLRHEIVRERFIPLIEQCSKTFETPEIYLDSIDLEQVETEMPSDGHLTSFLNEEDVKLYMSMHSTDVDEPSEKKTKKTSKPHKELSEADIRSIERSLKPQKPAVKKSKKKSKTRKNALKAKQSIPIAAPLGALNPSVPDTPVLSKPLEVLKDPAAKSLPLQSLDQVVCVFERHLLDAYGISHIDSPLKMQEKQVSKSQLARYQQLYAADCLAWTSELLESQKCTLSEAATLKSFALLWGYLFAEQGMTAVYIDRFPNDLLVHRLSFLARWLELPQDNVWLKFPVLDRNTICFRFGNAAGIKTPSDFETSKTADDLDKSLLAAMQLQIPLLQKHASKDSHEVVTAMASTLELFSKAKSESAKAPEKDSVLNKQLHEALAIIEQKIKKLSAEKREMPIKMLRDVRDHLMHLNQIASLMPKFNTNPRYALVLMQMMLLSTHSLVENLGLYLATQKVGNDDFLYQLDASLHDLQYFKEEFGLGASLKGPQQELFVDLNIGNKGMYPHGYFAKTPKKFNSKLMVFLNELYERSKTATLSGDGFIPGGMSESYVPRLLVHVDDLICLTHSLVQQHLF